MTAHKALIFVAVALSGSLFTGACSSNDASLGRNQGPSNADGGTGGSTSTSTGGSMSKGTSGSGNGAAGATGNTGGTGPAMGGYGGSTSSECENIQCFRSIDCVEECGGPVLKSSCCPCDPGTFDNIECTTDGGVPTALNTPCVDDMCPEGLTPIHYYGIAGESGPLFCSCSIPCEDNPNVCPAGTSCVTIADGPGTVCSEI